MWLDASSFNGWVSLEDLPEPILMRSRGWLVIDTDDYVCLAGTLSPSNNMYSETIAIPRGMIEVMHELKIS